MSIKLETVQNWIKTLDPEQNWIKYELNDKNLVYLVTCSLCKKFEDRLKGKRNFSAAFINGISGSSLKKDNVLKHSKSDMHVHALDYERRPTQTISALLKTPIGKALNHVEKEEKERVSKLIDIAYVIAKEELPFTTFPRIAALEKRHGVKLGDTYINDKKCKEFTDCIGQTMVENLKLELLSAKYFSVMVDESTDVSTIEKLLIFIKFLDANGDVQTKFVALSDVISANAVGIKTVLLNVLRDFGDTSMKLVAFCSDGASVNLGIRNGVATMLQEECPWLIVMHCLNHRLELAIKDSIKNTYFETIIKLLNDLYSYYKRSPKRRREIKELATVMSSEANSNMYNPKNIQGTRWIDHKRRAATALVKSYQIIVSHLENTSEEEGNPKSKGYVKILKSRKFVFYLLMMVKLYDTLSKLSLALQKDSCDILHAKSSLEIFENIMNSFQQGQFIQENLSTDSDSINACLILIMEGKDFSNISLTGPPIDTNPTSDFFKYLNVLKKCVSQRCSDLKNDKFQAVKILDASIWPRQQEALNIFGQNELNVLKEHYKPILKKNNVQLFEIDGEWAELKTFWLQNLIHLSNQDLWKYIVSTNRHRFPNISHIFEILLILPVSNAVVERCFSFMNRIKNDNRNQLQEHIVEHLIRISLEGPELEHYSSVAALNVFFETSRRPNIKPYGKRKREAAAASTSQAQQENTDDESDFSE